jgi:HD superfamily phosphohydrolase
MKWPIYLHEKEADAMETKDVSHIRDPIHGTISVTRKELQIIDHPTMQRLRNIKQLGFAELAFPGATHTRYSHSVGAMHVATRLFDRLFCAGELPDRVRQRFRQVVRLAMLFHDIGHAPLSHTTERLMPPVGELGLGRFAGTKVSRPANHEDYTLKMVLDSALATFVHGCFANNDIYTTDIAELMVGERFESHSGRFSYGGIDYTPVLRQIISSECDADRMDYLLRDSFFSGVSYGKFDVDWLVDNVCPVLQDQSVFLGIKSRGIFSFEDFLLSRYHMFAGVYLHHTPVVFEQMLLRYFEESDGEFDLPADIEKYAAIDDISLWVVLRNSQNQWAKRIMLRQPYSLLDERDENAQAESMDSGFHDALCDALREAGVDFISCRSESLLSKYFHLPEENPIYVVTGQNKVVPLNEFTHIFQRYEKPICLARIFVEPEQKERSKKVLEAFYESREKAWQPNVPLAEA